MEEQKSQVVKPYKTEKSKKEEVAEMFSNKSWKINKIKANRSINSNSNKRTGHFELLIKNY